LASIGYLIALARTSIWSELSERSRWRYALHLTGALLLLSFPAMVRWSFGARWDEEMGHRFLTILGLFGGWSFTTLCGWMWMARRQRPRATRRVREVAP
jgi:hypothetical protein